MLTALYVIVTIVTASVLGSAVCIRNLNARIRELERRVPDA